MLHIKPYKWLIFFLIIPISCYGQGLAQLVQNQTFIKEKIMSTATISTSIGDIQIELNLADAPISSQNFIDLANNSYYEGTIFHRIIEDFMVQGGGLDISMRNKPSNTEPIQNEANNGLKNDRGTIAMARTSEPHSATSQFFINHKNNDFLNFTAETPEGWGYAVFGKVIEGMDIIDKIAVSETTNVRGYADAPIDPVIINKVLINE